MLPGNRNPKGTSQRPWFNCKEVGHTKAECTNKKNCPEKHNRAVKRQKRGIEASRVAKDMPIFNPSLQSTALMDWSDSLHALTHPCSNPYTLIYTDNTSIIIFSFSTVLKEIRRISSYILNKLKKSDYFIPSFSFKVPPYPHSRSLKVRKSPLKTEY